MNQEYNSEKARRRASLGIPVDASPEEAERLLRQGLMDRGFTMEQIDEEFRVVQRAINYWAEYDAKQEEMDKIRALKEEQKRAKITIGDKWYYVENAVPLYIEAPLDSMKCENDDIPIAEAVANNGGRFFVCNIDLLDADWL